METFLNNSIKEFSEKAASSAPVPGGGGVSACVGALGAALGSMVCALTDGKKKYLNVQEDIKRISGELESLRNTLLGCIDGDAVAFEPLSAAYSLPKDTPNRDEIMEKCLVDAASIPFMIVENSCKAIPLLEELSGKGSKLAISDVAVAAALCRSAILGGAANIYINTKLMKNREYAEDLNNRTDSLIKEYSVRADAIYNNIMEGMK